MTESTLMLVDRLSVSKTGSRKGEFSSRGARSSESLGSSKKADGLSVIAPVIGRLIARHGPVLGSVVAEQVGSG
jgi:hypothetical protein